MIKEVKGALGAPGISEKVEYFQITRKKLIRNSIDQKARSENDGLKTTYLVPLWVFKMACEGIKRTARFHSKGVCVSCMFKLNNSHTETHPLSQTNFLSPQPMISAGAYKYFTMQLK